MHVSRSLSEHLFPTQTFGTSCIKLKNRTLTSEYMICISKFLGAGRGPNFRKTRREKRVVGFEEKGNKLEPFKTRLYVRLGIPTGTACRLEVPTRHLKISLLNENLPAAVVTNKPKISTRKNFQMYFFIILLVLVSNFSCSNWLAASSNSNGAG